MLGSYDPVFFTPDQDNRWAGWIPVRSVHLVLVGGSRWELNCAVRTVKCGFYMGMEVRATP